MALQRTPPNTIISKSTPQLHESSFSDLDTLETNVSIKKRYKRSFEEITDNTNSFTSEIRSMITDFITEQNKKFESITQTNSIKEQNFEIQKSVDFMSEKYDELISQVAILESENKSSKSRIQELEEKLEVQERNSRSTTVEIRNIPKLDKENKDNLIEIINKVSSIVKQPPFQENLEIREIYRPKTKNETVVVDFTTTTRKSMFIKHVIAYNKSQKLLHQPTLNTSNLNIQGPPKTIFISDFLTTKARRLYFLARQQAREQNYYRCWTSFGRVFIQKQEKSPVTRIEEQEDLRKLM